MALQKVFEDLAKKYGKPVVFTGSEIEGIRKVPTDIPAFDYVTAGGFLVGQCNELYGNMSSLKSFVSYTALAKFQRYDWANNEPNAINKITYKTSKTRSKDEALQGMTFAEIDTITPRRGYKPKHPIKAKRVALVDVEGTYEKEWGAKIGIDNEGLIYLKPDSMNVAIDLIEVLLSDPDVSLVVLDSMVAIGSDAENDNSMENLQMGVNAALWNKGARKLRSAMSRNPESDSTLIAINSSYDKLGMAFGDPEQLKNGKQFSLFKSLSVKMTGLKTIKSKLDGTTEVVIGRNISLYNKKNKFGEPFRESSFYFSFVDDGELKVAQTDTTAQLIELGLMFGIIERKGNYYTYKTAAGNGIEGFKNKLSASGAISELKEQVYTLIDKK